MKLERSLVINALVLGAALVSGTAIFLTRGTTSSEERDARRNNLCPEFPRDALQSLEVKQGDRHFELERKASADAGAPAFELHGGGPTDPEAIESLLRALEVASFVRRFDEKEVDRKAFGLDAPRASLRAHFANSELEVHVGKAAPTTGESYVEAISRAHGTRIGLVKDSSLKDILPDADALRPKTLLPLAVSELTELSFKDAGHDVHVRRSKGPSFVDERGQRVQRDAIERLGYELFALKAERFLTLPEANAALDAGGSLAATFTRKDGVVFAARLGGSCPSDREASVFVRVKPTPLAACAPGGVRQLFWNAANTLENDDTFDLHVDEVESMRIERGGKKLELTRGERGFSLRAPSVADVTLDAGNQRIRSLITEGQRVAEPNLQALGLALPSGKVTLHSTTLHETPSFDEVLELGRADADGRLAVRRAEDGVVLWLERDAARAFQVDATLLRGTQLFDFGLSDFVELDVSWGNEHERLRRSPSGAFELLTPALPHDATLSLELVQALGTLSVERWVSDEDDGSFGFAKPRVRAELTLTPGDAGQRHFTLLVGNETAGGAYANLAEQPGVFVIERDLVWRLTTLLLTRAAFASDANTLERVELSYRGKTRVIARKGNELRVIEGPPLPPDVITTITDALANLRADAAIHTGAARPEEGFQKPLLEAKISARAGLGVNKSFRIGAGDAYRDTAVYYARVDGIDATFAIPKSTLRPVIDAL